MPKMHLRCTRTACLLVAVVNKTSRSDWEGLQKHGEPDPSVLSAKDGCSVKIGVLLLIYLFMKLLL